MLTMQNLISNFYVLEDIIMLKHDILLSTFTHCSLKVLEKFSISRNWS